MSAIDAKLTCALHGLQCAKNGRYGAAWTLLYHFIHDGQIG
ncbi:MULTISPECIES: hypothetical protein [unclassified Enterobacter]|jgi:hypothetical protein|nr:MULTISPECIES: hypothetical protein [unclassified Enterobacter]MBB3307732.1 hypothetical protein [Enterobacter sp. Sphag1F]NYI16544.1 hypothetical protein [Enterobacter sp. Sphag71]